MNRYPSHSHYHLYLHHRPPIEYKFGSVQSNAYATLLERSDDNAHRDGFTCSRHPPRDFWRSCAQGAVEGNGQIRTANFFFRLRNRQKLVRIRFENIRYLHLLNKPEEIFNILIGTLIQILTLHFSNSEEYLCIINKGKSEDFENSVGWNMPLTSTRDPNV